MTYAVPFIQEVQKSKICEMKVEKNFQPSSEYKDPGEHFERAEFFDPRETPSQSIFQHTLKDRASTNIKPVVLRKLFALQLIPKEITLPKTEGRNLVEVTEGLI